MTEPHAVVVLAAGGSRRLGRPKQTLTINGMSLLQHVVELAVATKPARIVVVLGANAEKLSPLLERIVFATLGCVVNREWQEGMASSLRFAANELATWTGPTLVLACDQPRLRVEHLQALLDAAIANPDSDIASAYADTIGIPALVRASTLSLAATLHGDSGLRRLWKSSDAAVIGIEARELAFDIDTPADLADAIEAGWIDDQ